MGRLGQKTGKGWYKYDENRRALPDPEVEALAEQTAKEAGIQRRTIDNKEIVERCIYAMINEGARLLEEGCALRASDIDTVYLARLRLPELPRRPDVVRRYRRTEECPRADRGVPSEAR